MEKIIHSLISNWIKGVDIYTHNGSTWLIFTDSKKWVIELTESKTLWYNYNFFKQIFEFTSLDVVDNQHYITKWVEDNVIGGVKRTMSETIPDSFLIEDTIQNGVKRTQDNPFSMITNVENTIQNGVKETIELMNELPNRVKKIIKKGVKETNHVDVMKFFDNKMDDAIENGVKETQFNSYENKSWVEGVIKGGVKHTEYGDWLDGDERLDEIVENGVKETIECDWNIPKYVINEVIIEGVKETNHVDVMKFFDNKMEDAIQNGIKETQFNDNENKSWVEGVIKGGVKHTEIGWHQCNNIDDVIDYGVKEIFDTEFMPQAIVNDIIQNGVKETKTPGKDGDILSTIEWMEENKSTSYTKMIDDVIDNGEKINGTYVGGKRQKENIESVIGYGTKN